MVLDIPGVPQLLKSENVKEMKIDDFINALKELLEIEDLDLQLETNLRDLPEFTSLVVMGMVALIDENFNRRLTGDQFSEITTVKSLIDVIGIDYFEE